MIKWAGRTGKEQGTEVRGEGGGEGKRQKAKGTGIAAGCAPRNDSGAGFPIKSGMTEG